MVGKKKNFQSVLRGKGFFKKIQTPDIINNMRILAVEDISNGL